jgi:hypothetical protein
MMLALTIISSIAAVAAFWYARKQTVLAQTLAARQAEQEREVFHWQRRHEELALVLSRIRPQMLVQSDGHQGPFWPTLIPDNRLREQAETYIVELVDNKMRLTPRKPTELELRSRQLRDTVDKMIKTLEELREKRPDLYKYMA